MSTTSYEDNMSFPFGSSSNLPLDSNFDGAVSGGEMMGRMEDTLDLSSFAVPNLAWEQLLEDPNHGELILTSTFSHDMHVKREKGVESEKESSPTSFIAEEEEEDEENMKWELELEQLIGENDGDIPLDPKLKQELLDAPVKDFNRRTKTLKLDSKVVQFLKQQRKRLKNRQAAIRSRTRKETRVVDLQKQVDMLLAENQNQKALIRQLMARLEKCENQKGHATSGV